MTVCVAACNGNSTVLSNIDRDHCFVYTSDGRSVKDLTEHLGEAYDKLPINNRDLQRACAAFSADGKTFAYNPNKGKLLSVWNTDGEWSLVGNKPLAKHATVVVFTPLTDAIIVGDKKGDVYSFGGSSTDRILGHSSMILDVCFSRDEKYIVTCDSDEKVRVSYYPNGKNILYYLMGHEAYVSGVCVLRNDLILSGSGDGTLRLWDMNGGGLLDKRDLDVPIQGVVEVHGMAAVRLHESDSVHLVEPVEENGKWTIRIASTVRYDGNVLHMAAEKQHSLWIVAAARVQRYDVARAEYVEEDVLSEQLQNLLGHFVHLENTNLMTFLHRKMVDKRKRIEQTCNDRTTLKTVF